MTVKSPNKPIGKFSTYTLSKILFELKICKIVSPFSVSFTVDFKEFKI